MDSDTNGLNADMEGGPISDIAQNIHSKLASSKQDNTTKVFTIVTLLENLGGLLTDSASVARRKRGLDILSSVINKLASDFLQPEECRLLSDFYCDRTKDHHSLNPEVISGMSGLGQSSNIDGTALRKLVQTYFNEIPTQSQKS